MRPPSQWTEDDLNFLIANKLGETMEREYKKSLTAGSPLERKELCKDVSAFANSQGGVIIFGLREARQENAGSIPESLSPIADLRLKEIAQQVILDGVNPRMDFRFYSTPASNGRGEYVIIEVPKSLRGLHMLTLGGDSRYYVRRDFQSVPMTAYEIEEAYRNYALSEERVQLELAKFKLTNPNVNLPPPRNAWLAFTVVPRFPTKDLFVPLCSKPRHEIPGKAKGLLTRSGLPGADNFWSNYYGMLSFAIPDETAYKHQIFREGAVYLGMILNPGRRDEKGIFSLALVREFHDMLSLAVGLFFDAGYLGPIRILVELEQIRFFELRTNDPTSRVNQTFPVESFTHSIDTTVRDAVENPSAVLEEVHHHLWHSFGYNRCQLYKFGEPGVYVDRVKEELHFVND